MEQAKPLILSPERQDFLKHAKSLDGKPYIWGGKGYKWQPDGRDCSGLVTDSLYHATKGRLNWREMNCNMLWDATKDTNNPLPGDLVFYGPGKNMLTHVMVYMGDGTVYGACGGNQYVTSIEIAKKKGAQVRYRPKPKYRPDFRGYKSLPL